MTPLPKRAATLAAASLLLSSALLGAPHSASAVTDRPSSAGAGATGMSGIHACRQGEIDRGTVQRAAFLTHKAFVVTHATRRRIPAHTEFDKSVALETQTVLEASIKISASVEAEAGAFFAKAKVTAGVEIGGKGSHTSKKTETEEFKIQPSKKSRLFIFYSGDDTFAFKIQQRNCNRGGQQDYFGKLGSFSTVDETGAVLCPHSRYKYGSIPYQVAVTGGC